MTVRWETTNVGGKPMRIYMGVPDTAARERLVAKFDLDVTKPEWALGYRFDIVLRGRAATPTQGEP